MTEIPRIWTLERENYVWHVSAYTGATIKAEPPREVIEKAPVDAERERMLGVIAGLLRDLNAEEVHDWSNAERAEALLREHGLRRGCETGRS